jgi:hypothetical protein
MFCLTGYREASALVAKRKKYSKEPKKSWKNLLKPSSRIGIVKQKSFQEIRLIRF